MKIIASILLSTILINPLYADQWIQVDGGAIELDLNQETMENNLWIYIRNNSNQKFETRDKYTYQYRVDVNNRMMINAMCFTYGTTDLHKQFLMVRDGGSCFFQIHYNVNNGEFYNLYINGQT